MYQMLLCLNDLEIRESIKSVFSAVTSAIKKVRILYVIDSLCVDINATLRQLLVMFCTEAPKKKEKKKQTRMKKRAF